MVCRALAEVRHAKPHPAFPGDGIPTLAHPCLPSVRHRGAATVLYRAAGAGPTPLPSARMPPTHDAFPRRHTPKRLSRSLATARAHGTRVRRLRHVGSTAIHAMYPPGSSQSSHMPMRTWPSLVAMLDGLRSYIRTIAVHRGHAPTHRARRPTQNVNPTLPRPIGAPPARHWDERLCRDVVQLSNSFVRLPHAHRVSWVVFLRIHSLPFSCGDRVGQHSTCKGHSHPSPIQPCNHPSPFRLGVDRSLDWLFCAQGARVPTQRQWTHSWIQAAPRPTHPGCGCSGTASARLDAHAVGVEPQFSDRLRLQALCLWVSVTLSVSVDRPSTSRRVLTPG
jgi:hypothetical protein